MVTVTVPDDRACPCPAAWSPCTCPPCRPVPRHRVRRPATTASKGLPFFTFGGTAAAVVVDAAPLADRRRHRLGGPVVGAVTAVADGVVCARPPPACPQRHPGRATGQGGGAERGAALRDRDPSPSGRSRCHRRRSPLAHRAGRAERRRLGHVSGRDRGRREHFLAGRDLDVVHEPADHATAAVAAHREPDADGVAVGHAQGGVGQVDDRRTPVRVGLAAVGAGEAGLPPASGLAPPFSALVASVVGPLNRYADAGTVVQVSPSSLLICTVPPSYPISVSMLWSKLSRAVSAMSPSVPTVIGGPFRGSWRWRSRPPRRWDTLVGRRPEGRPRVAGGQVALRQLTGEPPWLVDAHPGTRCRRPEHRVVQSLTSPSKSSARRGPSTGADPAGAAGAFGASSGWKLHWVGSCVYSTAALTAATWAQSPAVIVAGCVSRVLLAFAHRRRCRRPPDPSGRHTTKRAMPPGR